MIKRKPGKPITAHRLFPIALALWVAALFGLVSMAVPVRTMEGLVIATGLPHVVPAAAPPLGFTAHVLVALLLTAFGGLAGLLVGLSLSRRHLLAGATDEVGAFRAADGLKDFGPPADGSGTEAPRVRARDSHPDAPPRRPLVLSEELLAETQVLELPVPAAGDMLIDADVLPDVAIAAAPFAPPASFTAPAPFAPPPFGTVFVNAQDQESVATPVAPAEPAWVAEMFGETPPAAMAPAMADTCQEALPEVQPDEEPLGCPAEESLSGAIRSPVAGLPLDSLGLVQLVERLALSIAERRARLAAQDGDAVAGDGADERTALPEAQPVDAVATALGAATLHDLPLRFRMPEQQRKEDGAEPAAIRIGQGGVTPFGRPRTLTFPEPVPASGPAFGTSPLPDGMPDAHEADRALRAALETLQRMTAKG